MYFLAGRTTRSNASRSSHRCAGWPRRGLRSGSSRPDGHIRPAPTYLLRPALEKFGRGDCDVFAVGIRARRAIDQNFELRSGDDCPRSGVDQSNGEKPKHKPSHYALVSLSRHGRSGFEREERSRRAMSANSASALEPLATLRSGLLGMTDIVDCVTRHRSKWFERPYGFVLKRRRALPFVGWRGALGLKNAPKRLLNSIQRERTWR